MRKEGGTIVLSGAEAFFAQGNDSLHPIMNSFRELSDGSYVAEFDNKKLLNRIFKLIKEGMFYSVVVAENIQATMC